MVAPLAPVIIEKDADEGGRFRVHERSLPRPGNVHSADGWRDVLAHQQISPIKGQIVIYRPSIGPDSLRGTLRATFVGNHRESSGE